MLFSDLLLFCCTYYLFHQRICGYWRRHWACSGYLSSCWIGMLKESIKSDLSELHEICNGTSSAPLHVACLWLMLPITGWAKLSSLECVSLSGHTQKHAFHLGFSSHFNEYLKYIILFPVQTSGREERIFTLISYPVWLSLKILICYPLLPHPLSP